jgi:hypothetical protein
VVSNHKHPEVLKLVHQLQRSLALPNRNPLNNISTSLLQLLHSVALPNLNLSNNIPTSLLQLLHLVALPNLNLSNNIPTSLLQLQRFLVLPSHSAQLTKQLLYTSPVVKIKI